MSNDITFEKVIIVGSLIILLFIILSKPNVSTGGDVKRNKTLPIAISIGTGGATNTISQGDAAIDKYCPHCGQLIES